MLNFARLEAFAGSASVSGGIAQRKGIFHAIGVLPVQRRPA
jgi:hypothetical protein